MDATNDFSTLACRAFASRLVDQRSYSRIMGSYGCEVAEAMLQAHAEGRDPLLVGLAMVEGA